MVTSVISSIIDRHLQKRNFQMLKEKQLLFGKFNSNMLIMFHSLSIITNYFKFFLWWMLDIQSSLKSWISWEVMISFHLTGCESPFSLKSKNYIKTCKSSKEYLAKPLLRTALSTDSSLDPRETGIFNFIPSPNRHFSQGNF